MITIILGLLILLVATIKLVNYARWSGKQGNLRGALGLYLLAILTIGTPVGVYVLNMLR
ncbi:hypothetical protein [Desulfotomaculum sp. 1211_IL3151]|uniref:hypothetical protein n=1 Tax=Desulfotomaculum sp. 1211_IL3151 TaxID=3084055 RepID=UPI002FD9CC6B